MKRFLLNHERITPISLPVFLIVILFAASSLGAVLNPFPSPERVPIYQQIVPRARQRQPATELEQFQQDLKKFSCTDIEELTKKLQQQLNTATTVADRNYFNEFLNALQAEKRKKCNK
ncbi:MAG TPA: hypothetical protein ENJ30_03250 [Desulfobulbaceae bacterium]|nr:hypothetical protein [Desulfobulbaceae bacterium]